MLNDVFPSYHKSRVEHINFPPPEDVFDGQCRRNDSKTELEKLNCASHDWILPCISRKLCSRAITVGKKVVSNESVKTNKKVREQRLCLLNV